MSGATDCYQPAERHFRLTRRCLEVCAGTAPSDFHHYEKRASSPSDLDVLTELARYELASACTFSVTTLDNRARRQTRNRGPRARKSATSGPFGS